LLELEALAAVDGEAGAADAEAGIVPGGETESLAVEDGRSVEIGGIESDVGDAGDGRAELGERRKRVAAKAKEGEEVKEVEERIAGGGVGRGWGWR
jgi:hypothetical protein